jgi:predicted dehydrogenase
MAKVKTMVTRESMGDITAIHTHMWRNARYGGWKREIPADCDADHVDWKMFQGDSALHHFDPNRVINWRFFWDYSGGNVFENMVHQVGFWYKVLDLRVPRSVAMSGGNYLAPNMQVPDTMNASLDQHENILFTWNSGFGNHHYDAEDDLLLGTKGTVVRNSSDAEYIPEGGSRRQSALESYQPAKGTNSPDIVGFDEDTGIHFNNFFDCVRSRKQPNCPFDLGYRAAIACQMAVRSYREGRTVRWDPESEDIV